jgi:hypothetical protein
VKTLIATVLFFAVTSVVYAQHPMSRADALSIAQSLADDFFNDLDHLKVSGCTQESWTAMHFAVVANILNQPVKENQATRAKIKQCYNVVMNSEVVFFSQLRSAVDQGKGSKEEILQMLDKDNLLWEIEDWAQEAYQTYAGRCQE